MMVINVSTNAIQLLRIIEGSFNSVEDNISTNFYQIFFFMPLEIDTIDNQISPSLLQ